jgi:hypothetical protein
MDNIFPDCLVLKIEEYDKNTNELDMTIYIFYDQKEKLFVIKGKRSDKKINSAPFSFNCKFIYELLEFVTFIIFTKNLWKYTLYNYDNLPADSNDTTYDFFYKHDSEEYELVSYEPQNFNLVQLKSYLRILKNVFNYYN